MSPDPEADRGQNHFSFALYPHTGDWKEAMSVRHGYDFNYPLTAMQVDAHTGTMPAEHSFVTVAPDDVVLTAIKKAEDSNALIFHMYEWAGKSGSVEIAVPKGATGAVETNLLEQAEGKALTIKEDRSRLCRFAPMRFWQSESTIRIEHVRAAVTARLITIGHSAGDCSTWTF